jgi:predicted XRE-type DNA-binding protein
MKKNRFKSVWDAIEDTPGEAANMKTRSALMMAISGYITQQGWSQAEAATALGVTQPRISDLMRGKVQLFSIDTLVNMLAGAGFRVEMQVTKRRKKAA